MELAYKWLCKQREEHSHNNSVWDLRYNWETVKPLLQNQLLTNTKQQLRKVIRLTHKILTKLKLKMHPDKTFLGCIKKGFDFLGVHFGDTPEISKTSQENHHAKIAQRYAQGASTACIGAYVARWTSWFGSVLNCCTGREVIRNSQGQIAHKLFDSLGQIQEKYYESSKADTFNDQVLA